MEIIRKKKKKKDKKKNAVPITQTKLDNMLEFLRTDHSQRISNLETINEYGHALLIKWNQLELPLKLNYFEKTGKYPQELKEVLDCKALSLTNFISKIKHTKSYSTIFGRQKSNGALVLRNNVVHLSFIPSESQYQDAIKEINDIIEIIKKEGVDIQTIKLKNKKNNKSSKPIK